jgi:hypothetical protein
LTRATQQTIQVKIVGYLINLNQAATSRNLSTVSMSLSRLPNRNNRAKTQVKLYVHRVILHKLCQSIIEGMKIIFTSVLDF